MGMNRFAEIDAQGLCFATLDTSGEIDAPNMVPIGPAEDRRGQRWDGAAWGAPLADVKAQAAAELAAIDQATGMSRTMREWALAVGAKVGVDVTYLQQQETKAAAARLKLK